MTSWITLPERHPKRTLVVAAVVLVLAAVSVLRLRPDPSLAPLIPDGIPAASALRTLSDRFEVADRVMVLLEADESASGDRTAELVAAARRFGDAVSADAEAGPMTRAVVVEAGADTAAWIREGIAPAALWYLNDPAFAELQRRLTAGGLRERLGRVADLLAAGVPGSQAAVAAAVADPVGVSELLVASAEARGGGLDRGFFDAGPLVSPDGRALLMQLVPEGPPGDVEFATRYTASLEAVIDRETAAEGGPSIRLFGAPPTTAHSASSIRSDMNRSITGSVILLQLLFLFAYRRLLAFPLAALPLAAGLLLGFGVYGCFRASLTPLTAAAGAVLAGLGVDFAIHRLGHNARGELGERGEFEKRGRFEKRGEFEKPGRFEKPGSGNLALAGPMAAACGTSLVGFAAMTGSSVPAVRDFALIGALGLGGALVASLTLLPALLAVTTRGRPSAVARDRFARGLAAAVVKRPRAAQALALGAGAVVLVAVAWPGGGERFAHDLKALNPSPSPPLEAQKDAERHFAAADARLLVLVSADDHAGLLQADASVAAAVEDAATALAEAVGGRVSTRVAGLSGLLPDPARERPRRQAIEALDADAIELRLSEAAEAAGFAPEAFDSATAYLRSLLEAPAPGEADLRQRPLLAATVLPTEAAVAGERHFALATVFWTLPPEVDPVTARGRVVDVLGDAVDAVDGATATGIERGGRVVGDQLGGELAWMLGLAGAGVLAWLGLCFRSVRAVGLVLVPPAAGVLAVLAAGNLAGVPLNLLSVLALPLLVGIGVDDGVFLVGHAKRGGEEAIASLGNSLHAVTVTSLSTAAGFGSLTLTSTPAIQALGGTLAVGVLACWGASVLWVLPRVGQAAGPEVTGPSRGLPR